MEQVHSTDQAPSMILTERTAGFPEAVTLEEALQFQEAMDLQVSIVLLSPQLLCFVVIQIYDGFQLYTWTYSVIIREISELRIGCP